MRFFSLLSLHAILHAGFVASDLFVYVEDDLVGGQQAAVNYYPLVYLPIFEDLSFFEIVIFSGNNTHPITIYTSRRYDFSTAVTRMSADPYSYKFYTVFLTVPLSVGSNIARGYCLGLRSHLTQNEDIEVINYTRRVSMINNGTLQPEVAEAAYTQGQKSPLGPDTTFACKGKPCTRDTAFAGLQLTPYKVERKKNVWSSNQKYTVAISITVGVLAIMLFIWICWRCRKIRKGNRSLGKRNAKLMWWKSIPSPEAGTSELQGAAGPYTTAELVGEGHCGPAFELQAGSIRKGEGLAEVRKEQSTMDAIELDETETSRFVEEDKHNGEIREDIEIAPMAELNSQTSGTENIQLDPTISRHSPEHLGNMDGEHGHKPAPIETSHPCRDESPHETTAMFESTPSPTELPEVVVPQDCTTKPTSQTPSQTPTGEASTSKQTKRMTDPNLEALTGAFAPPVPQRKRKSRIESWIYK
ncbi:hypothetical protein VTL71DRAFT_11166 [Oculimacula yallundae]|uniref:Uncharacterized protein n=1 Tax=Oculimacula yallundae TaxID=86028 RepID=A0ABR4CVF6_9HELO